MNVLQEGGDGIANDGGTNSLTFANDGEMLYFARHPTWSFPLSVHGAYRSQTYWRIHRLFLSSSSTRTQKEAGKLLQETKRE